MKRSLGAKTLAMPSPLWVVDAYAAGVLDRTAVARGAIGCSKSPAASVSLRRATCEYACVVRRPAFTVNVPSAVCAGEADLVGVSSGRGDGDPRAAAGLTAVPSGPVDAPHGRTWPLNPECRLVDSLQLGLHMLFVGEIVDVKADEEVAGGRIGQAVVARTVATA